MVVERDFEASVFNVTKLEIRGGDAASRFSALLMARVLLAMIFISRLFLFTGNNALPDILSSANFLISAAYMLFHGLLLVMLKWKSEVTSPEIRGFVYAVLCMDVITYCIPLITAWYEPDDWVLLFGLTAITAGMFLRRSSALSLMGSVALLLIVPSLYRFTSDSFTRIVLNAYAGIGFMVVAFAVNELMQRTLKAEHQAKKSEESKVRTQRNQDIALTLLPAGLLVLGKNYRVEHINPAARILLHCDKDFDVKQGFSLKSLLKGDQIYQWVLDQQGQELSHPEELILEAGENKQLCLRLIAQWDETGILRLIMVEDFAMIEHSIQQQKLVAMGKLVASVAHEIRNPLSAIKNAAQLLAETENNARNKRLVELILINSNRIGTTVTDILDLGRKNAARRTAIVFLDIVHDVMDNLKLSTPRIAIYGADANVKVSFDAQHLNRILINLLTNAMRYASSNANAIVLNAELKEQQLKRLKVSNDGHPIEAHVLNRLFEPFSSTRVDGSGLGLYICNELCQRNGAKIFHQYEKSALGMKTCFVIDFALNT